MSGGRLIAVVGPSGVGKDSVMLGMCSAVPKLHLVRRVITRAPGLGGEDYEAVTEAEFSNMAGSGAFSLHWEAHGLHYGIPSTVTKRLSSGTDCLANFSRSALKEAAEIFPKLLVLNITASAAILSQRLTLRARETEEEIAQRISVADKALPEGLEVVHLSNDGPLAETIACAVELLQPVKP